MVCLVTGSASALDVGQRPPDLAATDIEGVPHRLHDYQGRVLYVDFWASWCAPCLQVLPALAALHDRYGTQGFDVVAINVDTRWGDAQRLIDRLQWDLPVIADPDGLWAQQFALPTMPSGYLIGRDGRVRHIQAGFRPADLPALEQAVQLAVEETP